MDGLTVGTESLVGAPNELSEALDCDLKFTSSGSTDSDTWWADSSPVVKYYLNGDSARTDDTLADGNEAWLQTIVESDSAETVKFYWSVWSRTPPSREAITPVRDPLGTAVLRLCSGW